VLSTNRWISIEGKNHEYVQGWRIKLNVFYLKPVNSVFGWGELKTLSPHSVDFSSEDTEPPFRGLPLLVKSCQLSRLRNESPGLTYCSVNRPDKHHFESFLNALLHLGFSKEHMFSKGGCVFCKMGGGWERG